MISSASRVIVVSDLHLGGEPPYMMSRPDRLARFLDSLPSRLAPDEALELVIAGDFVDFLAMTPHEAFTANPDVAAAKLAETMAPASPFSTVFDALGRLMAGGHRVTVILGNHDIELAFPQVQDALLSRLAASPHTLRLLDDGRALRIGGALIEHGNRYDGANVNDQDGLRAIASAASRFELAPAELNVSAGSLIVSKVINPIKAAYPFIDLLKPEGEMVALLLLAFEPSYLFHLGQLGRMLRGQRLAGSNLAGVQPGKTRSVAARPLDQNDAQLEAVFGTAWQALRATPTQVSASDLLRIAWSSRRDSLRELLDRDEPVPADRLAQIRTVLRKMLLDDRSARPDGPTEQYGAAAQRMIADSDGQVQAVVMGHTHLPRHVGPAERATYLNTGTWADVLRVPDDALADGNDAALQRFLLALRDDTVRDSPRTWGDLRVESPASGGQVSRAALRAQPAQ